VDKALGIVAPAKQFWNERSEWKNEARLVRKGAKPDRRLRRERPVYLFIQSIFIRIKSFTSRERFNSFGFILSVLRA